MLPLRYGAAKPKQLGMESSVILNLKGYQICFIDSKETAILLKRLILPVSIVALEGSAPAACAA